MGWKIIILVEFGVEKFQFSWRNWLIHTNVIFIQNNYKCFIEILSGLVCTNIYFKNRVGIMSQFLESKVTFSTLIGLGTTLWQDWDQIPEITFSAIWLSYIVVKRIFHTNLSPSFICSRIPTPYNSNKPIGLLFM